jgi:DNA-binding IclR family transcriptional regulator
MSTIPSLRRFEAAGRVREGLMREQGKTQALRGRGTDRVLDILDFLAAKGSSCTIPEIAAGTSSPRSTTYLMVEQLESRGYLDRSDSNRYRLGRSAALVGKAAMKHLDFARFARAAVQKLAAEADQLAEFVALDGWKQVVLMAAMARRPSYMLSAEGSRHPLPRTASSRFLLRDFAREQIVNGIPEPDYVLRDGSIMTPDAFIASIDSVRGSDVFALHGQVDPHLACIASPVFNIEGQCVATMSLVIPLVDLEGRFEFYAGHTRRAAETMTEQFSLAPVDRQGILSLVL